MTLMELVIGLAITGLMAAAGAGAFQSIVDHKRTIATANKSTERASALRETIRSWVTSGTPRIQLGGGPRGLTSGVGRGGPGSTGSTRTGGRGAMNVVDVTPAKAAGDELSIGGVAAMNPSMLSNVTLRLYVDADENTPEKGLTVEYQPTPQQPLMRKMLDSTIDVFTVEYLDGTTGRWIPSTEGATMSGGRAIRITMGSSVNKETQPILGLPMVIGMNLTTVRGPLR